MTRAGSPFHRRRAEDPKSSLAYVIASNSKGAQLFGTICRSSIGRSSLRYRSWSWGWRTRNGHPWATTLSGPPGFMNSADQNRLTIKAWLDRGDPLHSCIRDGAAIGGLGIEFVKRAVETAINGRIENCIFGEGFSIRVQQSFGNCPKYIQARSERPRPPFQAPCLNAEWPPDLGDKRGQLYCRSRHLLYCIPVGANSTGWKSSQGLDVSHRGGLPGFVRVVSPNELLLSGFQRQSALQHASAIWRRTRAPGFSSSTFEAAGCCTSSGEPGSAGTFRRTARSAGNRTAHLSRHPVAS